MPPESPTRPPVTEHRLAISQNPFISDRLDREITRTFQREILQVRIAHKSHTLRQALAQHTTERTCNRTNCPLSSTSLWLHRNAAYQLTCKACGKFYIGSTIRLLHDRVKEHLTDGNSSVKKHLITCHYNTQNIDAKIITQENDPTNLRLYEAFYISTI